MIYDSSNDALIKQLYQKLSKYINLTKLLVERDDGLPSTLEIILTDH